MVTKRLTAKEKAHIEFWCNAAVFSGEVALNLSKRGDVAGAGRNARQAARYAFEVYPELRG